MIRLRSTKLLSGVSALAVLTALGAAGPAMASTTFTGPGLFAPYTNDQLDFVLVQTHAVINSDSPTDSDEGNSITNAISMSGAGDKIAIDDSVLVGGILNTGSIVSTDSDGIDVRNFSVIAGTINNAGLIQGGTANSGIEINQSVLLGGIFNDIGGTITGAANGIYILNDATFIGGISNEGLISGAAGDGIQMSGANVDFVGGITNFASGTITSNGAAAAAIDIGFPTAISSFVGDITNSGTIQGLGGGTGIYVNATGFAGNIVNNESAIIQATSTNAIAISIAGGTFTGDITNSGQILATDANGVGIVIGGTTVFVGNVTNNEGGLIQAASTALSISSTSFHGNVLNQGQILSNSGTAVSIATTDFTGDLTNDTTGVITGNVGLRLQTGAVLTGNIDNKGSIVAATGDAIRLQGSVSGTVSNEGLIQSTNAAGIAVESTVGGITNSGTIIGVQSVDLQLATGATTITQTAGRMQGLLRLDQSGAEFVDTFNANGGTLTGNIDGGGGDIINVGGNFAYVSGAADQLDQLNINSGTAVFGSTAMGVDGAGVTFTNTNSMTVADGATAYLDDNTTIGLNNNLTVNSGGTLAYYVTSNTAVHGRINAGGAALDGTLLAVVDGSSFASIGGNTFTYTNIITGPVSGTFADVQTTSLFFAGKAIYHPAAVDLELLRLSFTDALVLGGLSQNELSVGGALETIYSNGGFGTDFTSLYNYLLGLPVGSEAAVAAIYDQLGGAEHAQVQQAALRTSEPFDNAIAARLDDGRLSLRGSRWADNDDRRYADAAQQTVMSDASAASAAGSQGLLRGSSGISLWGRGYGDWTTADGDANAQGYKQNAGGVIGGLDFAVAENAVIGGAFGWSTDNVDFDTPGDHANIDSFQFGGYGSYGFGAFYADAQASFAFHDVTTTRELDLGFGTRVAQASYNARAWTLAGEIGTVLKTGRTNFQPMLAVNYTGQSTDGFIESGAGNFGLVVADANTTSFTSTLGMRVSSLWTVGGMKLVPDASLAWRHEYADTRQSFTSAFLEDPSTQFQIVSSKMSPDSAVVAAGVTAGVTKGLEIFVDYNGILNTAADSHSGSAGLRATW